MSCSTPRGLLSGRADQGRQDEARRSAVARIEATLKRSRKHPAAYPGTFFTSSRTGEGIPELRGHIMQLMRERDGRGPPIVIASGSEAIQAKADEA